MTLSCKIVAAFDSYSNTTALALFRGWCRRPTDQPESVACARKTKRARSAPFGTSNALFPPKENYLAVATRL